MIKEFFANYFLHPATSPSTCAGNAIEVTSNDAEPGG